MFPQIVTRSSYSLRHRPNDFMLPTKSERNFTPSVAYSNEKVPRIEHVPSRTDHKSALCHHSQCRSHIRVSHDVWLFVLNCCMPVYHLRQCTYNFGQ